MLAKSRISQFLIILSLVWLGIIGIYIITRHYQLQLNMSSSMPQRLWLTHVGDNNVKRGDYVVIKFHDKRMVNPLDYEYVVKQVAGSGGDKIIAGEYAGSEATVAEPNDVIAVIIVNNELFSVFKTLSGNHFAPLTTTNILIPQGCYFLHGQHHPSFDSRYKEFGLICESQIYGKTKPLL